MQKNKIKMRGFMITITIIAILLLCQTSDEMDIIRAAAQRNNCKGEDFIILLAIRKAENGPPGREFGIMTDGVNNLDKQAGWCAATIVKNRKRWIDSGQKQEFIDFLGDRYAPINCENDPKGLNKNWKKNVKYWVSKLKEQNNAR